MTTARDLEPLILEPREDLSVEIKDWLDLSVNEHRATLAKASIALANHGGGFIILGMRESGEGFTSVQLPPEFPEVTQDAVNAAIRRFADPEFHAEVHFAPHPETDVCHAIVSIPSNLTEPVMSRRDCGDILSQARCYIRKPGPRSEEPQTSAEWKSLLGKCVRAGREDMLEAIRSIVSGRIRPPEVDVENGAALEAFVEAARERWQFLTESEPADSPARFPLGHYEMSFRLVGVEPADGLAQLQDYLAESRRIRLTGWTPFLELHRDGLASYPNHDVIEAWIGRDIGDRPARSPDHCDFWRASPDGMLYTIRGYTEDASERVRPGTATDITLPVWRIAEGLIFAARLAEAFGGADSISTYCRFEGLEGRALISLTGERALFGDDVCRTDSIELTTRAEVAQVRDNLAEIVHQLLAPLYEQFNFFRLRMPLVEEELQRLQAGRF